MIKLNQLKHGARVTCKIMGEYIDDAKISIDEDGTYFICQNKVRYGLADDLLGYKYSFNIGYPQTDKVLVKLLDFHNVTDLKLKHRKIEEATNYSGVVVFDDKRDWKSAICIDSDNIEDLLLQVKHYLEDDKVVEIIISNK